MPTCNKINCALILPPTDTPLPEYRRRYLDSSVSVYVPVPDIPILHAAPSFNIQLWTDGYIAPGLAVFVYIDGYYQCNRSKRMPPPDAVGGSSVEIRLRQKEEKVAGGEGEFVGREWRWVGLDVEQANGAKDSSRDAQDRIGKIEVVVLRCDDDATPKVEPRVQGPQFGAPAAKTSEKAPSAKAPSMKAPSAASEGLGGMFGLFDGACDFGLDGSSDGTKNDSLTDTPYDKYTGKSDSGQVSGRFAITSPQDGERRPMPIGLDGQEYEQPPVIVNQYGPLYDPRVPRYHNPGARRRRNTDDSYYVDDRVGYGPARVVPTQFAGKPTVGYKAAAPLNSTPPNVVRVPQGPVAQEPRFFMGVDGQRYVEHWERNTPAQQGPPPTLSRVAPYMRPDQQVQPRTEATNHYTPHHGQPVYIDGVRYIAQEAPLQQYETPRQQPRQPQPQEQPHIQTTQLDQKVAEQDIEEPPTIDPAFQRFQIFQMPEVIEELLEVDHRIVADAVPHMPQLKITPIAELDIQAMQRLKRHLKEALARGYYANGVMINEFVNPRGRETRFTRRTSPRRRMLSDRRHAERHSKWDGIADDKSWMGKHEKLGSHRGDKSDHHGAKSHRSSSKSVEHFGHTGQSNTGSKKSGSNNQNSSTDIWGDKADGNAQGIEANNNSWDTRGQNNGDQNNQADQSWGNDKDKQDNTNQGATGAGWGSTPNEQNKPDNAWGSTPNEQNKPADNWGGAPQAIDGAGARNPNHHAPSSHRSSNPSTSTNPHAYVQPYFQTWRGNGNGQNPTATKPLPRQAREPYTYLAPPTPHLPAAQLGDRSHGVRAGKGADYTHAVRRPKYMDTMEDPYAVFVFNYRSAEKLEEILHHDVRGDLRGISEEVGRGVLMNIPREKLVEELMKSQARAPNVSSAPAAAPAADPWGGNKAEERAKSNKTMSHAHQSIGNWSDNVLAPAAGKDDGWKPDTGDQSVKNGKSEKDFRAAGNTGWSFGGEGATGQADGFKAVENKPNGGW